METINIKLPEAVSKNIIEEIDCSLNILYPKIFYVINIKEESVEIIIPSISGIIPLMLFEISTRTPVEDITIYIISFPLIGKIYKLSYDKKKNEIEWLYRIGEDYSAYSRVLKMDRRENYNRVTQITNN